MKTREFRGYIDNIRDDMVSIQSRMDQVLPGEVKINHKTWTVIVADLVNDINQDVGIVRMLMTEATGVPKRMEILQALINILGSMENIILDRYKKEEQKLLEKEVGNKVMPWFGDTIDAELIGNLEKLAESLYNDGHIDTAYKIVKAIKNNEI